MPNGSAASPSLGAVTTLVTLLLYVIAGAEFLSGCSEQATLSKSEAEMIMADAKRLEKEQRLHQAYYKYKQVETTYEGTDAMHEDAWNAAQRIRASIDAQRTQIEVILHRYFERHGAYPSSLQDIHELLPAEMRATLDGFIYEKKGDTAFMLDDGIIGT